MRARSAGFTLVEMAVVLAIIGILLASLLLPLGTQLQQRKIADTQKRLEDAREALIGFAIINGRLPCPASANSAGIESFTPANTPPICSNPHDGFLPARTLSFNPQSSNGFAIDSWDNPIRYAVSRVPTVPSNPTAWYDTFTTVPVVGVAGIKYQEQSNTNGFAASQLLPDLRVCSTSSTITNAGMAKAACGPIVPSSNDITDATSVVAVIYSVGSNFGASGAAGTDEAANWNPNPADPTKLTTASRDRVFVSHTPAPAGATGGEFDDIVLWIPVATLFSRMIAAGTLP